MLVDMERRGFTIVELAVVITVMGILLVLGVVNLNAAQLSARDTERKTDIENIATNLEIFYSSGSISVESIGSYPSTTLIGDEQNMLNEINLQSLKAPNESSSSLIAATNNTQTISGVTPLPTIDQYVYQPIQNDKTLCTLSTQECRKYNLFYRLEADNTVYMVTSKNQ